MKFYPAILSDSVELIQRQLYLAQDIEQVEVVQIDILDGQFADNMTVTPIDLINLDFGELEADFHLMVEEPLDYIQEILGCEEQLPVRAVVAQIERMTSQKEVLQQLKKNKIQAGLSLDLFTPVEEIDWTNAQDLDVIQLMGIEAGFQGQKFDERVMNKLKLLRKKLKKQQLLVEIIVDGGVKFEQIKSLTKASVDAVAIGSLLWESDHPREIADRIIKL